MKKLSYISLAFATIGAVACSGNLAKYDISGANAPADGKTVYLIDQISAARIDSATVEAGTFRIRGKAPKDAFLSVNLDGSNWWTLLINDGEPVTIDLSDNTLSGSALNTKVTECDLWMSEKERELGRLGDQFESITEEEAPAFIEKYRAAVNAYRDELKGKLEENMDNLLPVAFAQQVVRLNGVDKFREILQGDSPFARHPYVQDLMKKIDEEEAEMKAMQERAQAVVGQKFQDLEEPDPDGNVHKLSEYLGRGNWVLVDFWASWCGPCHEEMPNVVEAYKAYHDKGFEIVGLSFDQDNEAWVRAIKDWEMPWIQLSDLQYWQSKAAKVYGIHAIPDNILIDPDGIIVAHGLRGPQLLARLAEIYE